MANRALSRRQRLEKSALAHALGIGRMAAAANMFEADLLTSQRSPIRFQKRENISISVYPLELFCSTLHRLEVPALRACRILSEHELPTFRQYREKERLPALISGNRAHTAHA
jgi:hypothetical protein